MQVIFIRHASAEQADKDKDETRRLTEEGKAEARTTAMALRRMGVKLERVLSSPLPRAVQTAEIIASVHADAQVEAIDLLAPPADAKGLRARLAQLLAGGPKAVAAVGHAPSLEECLSFLVAGRPKIGLVLSKAGAACVDLPAEWPDAMPELAWVMKRDQLAILAGK